MQRLTLLRLITLTSSITLAAAGVYYRASASDAPPVTVAKPAETGTQAPAASAQPPDLALYTSVMSSSKSAVPVLVPLPAKGAKQPATAQHADISPPPAGTAAAPAPALQSPSSPAAAHPDNAAPAH